MPSLLVANNDSHFHKRQKSQLLFHLLSCGNVFLCVVGTHEVQTCVANNCSTGGRVNISCNFTENSKAKGYLSIFCPKNNSFETFNSSQEMFVVGSRKDMTTSELKISVSGVPPDDYTVVVFDLASNGLPPALSGKTNFAAEEEENITVKDPGEAKGEEYPSGNILSRDLYV